MAADRLAVGICLTLAWTDRSGGRLLALEPVARAARELPRRRNPAAAHLRRRQQRDSPARFADRLPGRFHLLSTPGGLAGLASRPDLHPGYAPGLHGRLPGQGYGSRYPDGRNPGHE